MDLKEFHKRASSYINTIGPEQEKQLKEFLVCLVSWYFTNENISTYISGQYDKDEDFQRLKKHIEEREGDRENRNRYNLWICWHDFSIFYMALPPNVFTPVAQGLKKNVYPEKGIARLIVSLLLFRYLI